jgi:hypothetical protein
MATEKWFTHVKYTPFQGNLATQASAGEVDTQWTTDTKDEMNAMLAQLSAGSGADFRADQLRFIASIAEPIQTIIPYVEQFDRMFQHQNIGMLEDNLIGVEDIVNIAHTSHPRTEIFYNEPGYYFTRPTFTTFTTGFRMPWTLAARAGWNVLARQMNYITWEIARKRDSAAKAVIDAAIPSSHALSVTGNMTKAGVDEIIAKSASIGFPVKAAVLNPGMLMKMQGWNWGGSGFFVPQGVAQDLINNLYYGSYGGIQWFANPNAPLHTAYFFASPAQVGWHQTKGTPRTDNDIDIHLGVDYYAYRDALHAWYVGTGLGIWSITEI